MSEPLSLKAVRTHLRLMRAMVRNEPVNLQEYVQSHEAVFGAPPPVGDEAKHAVADALTDAIIGFVVRHGSIAEGDISRKVKTPQGLSISMRYLDLGKAAPDGKAFKIVGRWKGRVVLTLILKQCAAGSEEFATQLSLIEGLWIEPFLQDCRTMCPPQDNGGEDE